MARESVMRRGGEREYAVSSLNPGRRPPSGRWRALQTTGVEVHRGTQDRSFRLATKGADSATPNEPIPCSSGRIVPLGIHRPTSSHSRQCNGPCVKVRRAWVAQYRSNLIRKHGGRESCVHKEIFPHSLKTPREKQQDDAGSQTFCMKPACRLLTRLSSPRHQRLIAAKRKRRSGNAASIRTSFPTKPDLVSAASLAST